MVGRMNNQPTPRDSSRPARCRAAGAVRGLAVAAALWAGAPLVAQDAPGLLAAGQRAYAAGDVAAAKRAFTQVLDQEPGNKTALGFMRMIAANEARGGGDATALEHKLAGVVIDKVEFREAPFNTVVEFFKQFAAKQSVTANFVSLLPPERAAAPVTLAVRSIPLVEALRYACEQIGAEYAVDAHAVVIRPKGGAAAPAGAPAAQ